MVRGMDESAAGSLEARCRAPGASASCSLPASAGRRELFVRALQATFLVPGTAASALLLSACGSTASRVAQRDDSALNSRPAASPGGPGSASAGFEAEVVLHAMALIGVPYQWGGNDPEDGLDCSGLVVHVFDEAAGIKLPRTSRQISSRGRRVSRNGLQEADLVFFTTSRQRFSHVGIYVGNGRFIHAPSTGSTVRLDSVANAWWAKRFAGARRLIG